MGAASQLALVSGNNQTGTAGTALSAPLIVAVRDANGNAVAGVAVSFAVTAGGGSLSAATVTTGATGQAQTSLTLGRTAGSNTVTASVAGLTGSPVTFTATGTAGAATQAAIVSGNAQTGIAGSALSPFVVSVRDANGNAVAGFSVTFAVTSGGGTLSTTVAVSNTSGQAQTTLTLGRTAGTNTVTATAAGLTGSPLTFTATATAGAASQLALVSGNNQTAPAGTALPSPFVVAARDASGNPVAGVTVTFAVTAGGGTISATSVATGATGLAQTTLTLGRTLGTNTVTASATGVAPVTFTATGAAGTATQLALVSGNNQSAAAGATLSSPFVVAVRDAAGNPVAGHTVTFAVTAGGGTLSATSAATNALGQAQTTLTLGRTAGTNTVTASAAGLTGSPVTFTATGTVGVATRLVLSAGNLQTGRISTALPAPLSVIAQDSNGNGVGGVTVTFAVSAGGGSVSPASAVTDPQGRAQTLFTLGPAPGANTATASAAGLTGSPVTFTATGTALTFTTDVQPILNARCVVCHAPGGPSQFTPLTNYTQVRFGVSFFTGAPLVVPGDPAGSVLVMKTQPAGTMHVNLGPDAATRDANAKIISDWIAQGAFNTAVGPATQLSLVSGNNQSGAAGAPLPAPFVVAVYDANLNPISGATVTFAVTSGGGTLSATSVRTDAQGRASTRLTLGTAGGTNTVTATSFGLTGSPITFNATGAAGTFTGGALAGSTNPFDSAAIVALKAANVEPVSLSSDSEFLRRVTADLAGRLPTEAEWNTFAASSDPAKRDQAIDRLLASADFASFWGRDILGAWMCIDKNADDITATDITDFENYLVDAANTDKPLSTVISELAQGLGTGGVAFDKFNMHDNQRYKAADRFMETFAGIPSRCSRCHDSRLTTPGDDPTWTRQQNYGLYRFFQVDSNEFSLSGNTLAFVVDGVSTNPTGLPVITDPLATRRARFAQLFTASKAFPRGTAHRIFAELMDPLLNPNQLLAQPLAAVKTPAVLSASTSVFVAQGTSLKGYLRTLTQSKLYQLSTFGTTTAYDGILARHRVRRHAAEVLQRGIVGVTGIADGSSDRTFFLDAFGYPMIRSSITERTMGLNTLQPLLLLNSSASVPGKVASSTGTVALLAADVDAGRATLDAAITRIFRMALSRDPTPAQLTTLKSELSTAATTREKLEDVAAVVMASMEFTTR